MTTQWRARRLRRSPRTKQKRTAARKEDHLDTSTCRKSCTRSFRPPVPDSRSTSTYLLVDKLFQKLPAFQVSWRQRTSVSSVSNLWLMLQVLRTLQGLTRAYLSLAYHQVSHTTLLKFYILLSQIFIFAYCFNFIAKWQFESLIEYLNSVGSNYIKLTRKMHENTSVHFNGSS